MDETTQRHDDCPVDRLLNQISGPWTTYILWLLGQNAVLRFGELRAAMPGISPKVLTERLRRLEGDGLVSREQRPTIPPQVYYRLTARGAELRTILDDIGATALRWAAEDEARANPGAQAREA
ncbi:winged helix-turn-helix transcriptional regulator [Rhodoblastus sp.]|uniref:winged helix-turn-helix transcriptional regulator n=1 Tax=Rhodoblastus sp. TaxID=1962975 RepID=UPI0035AE35AA